MSKHSIKDFNPTRVAVLDAQMWQAYYAHRFFRLFRLLVLLFKEQFGVSVLTATRLAYLSGRAVVVFRKTENSDQSRAYLKRFYELVNKHSREAIDAVKCSNGELNWWVVHRYKNHNDKSLIDAVSQAKAAFYMIEPDRLKQFGREYVTATEIRDKAAHINQVEPEWAAITEHLKRAYVHLHQSVNV
jgi:hypothetical protein